MPRLALGLVAASLLLTGVPGVTEAQSPRYTRSTKVKVNVKQTEKTRKMKPKKKKKDFRPVITADAFIRIQGKIGHIRKAQIAGFKALIDETDKDDAELPDLHFRLAEIYAQQQRYWRFRGMELYAKLDKTKNKSVRASIKRKQASFFRASRIQLFNAIKTYKRLSNDPKFKNYSRMPEALFYYAYSLQNAKMPNKSEQAKLLTEARKIYHKLITDYPNSKFIPQAYLAFADYFFAQNSMVNAEKFYDKVLQFPKSPAWTYALYKKGWVYLNQKRYQLALEVFYKVVNKTRGKKSAKSINTAAKKDYVRAYAQIGRAQMAYNAFKRVDRKFAFKMLQILGEIYLDQGAVAKSIYTFRELMKTKPKHKLVCDWEYNVVHAMLSASVPIRKKVSEIENLVNLYSVLRKRKTLPKTNFDECEENAQVVNSEMAKIWHAEANKTLNTSTLAYVERLYRLYVKTFPNSDDVGEMRYYLAELAWQRAEGEKNARRATDLWENAAVAFTDVVKSGKVKGKQLKESAYAAVLAWKNALAIDPRTKAPSTATANYKKIPKAKPIPARRMKMIAAFDIYIKYVKNPKDDELVMMKFLKARIYWRYNHLAKAVPLFGDIVKTHPDHETALYAANLLLDTLNRGQMYGKMLKWVDYMLSKKKWLEDKEELASTLNTLKGQSLRKAAEQLEKQGKNVECAQAYLQIFNRNPNADKNDQVLYNAGVCFENGKSIGAAIAMFTTLSKRYPKSLNTKKAIARLGRNYARIAWYGRAASKFEEYAKRFAGEKGAPEVLGEAVLYRKGLGSDDKAVSDTRTFIAKFGKKKKYKATAAEAFFGLTSIYEKQGNDDKVVRHLRKYLKRFGKTGGADRRVVAYSKIGVILWKQSCKKTRGVLGACVRITRSRASLRKRKRRRKRKRAVLPTQCGPESKIKLVVVERDKRLARAGRKAFAAAIRAYKGGKAKVGGKGDTKKFRAAVMDKYYAQAEFYMVEQAYEKFLELQFPRKLDFDPKNKKKRKKSLKRFLDWIKKKKQMMSALVRPPGAKPAGKYRRIVDFKGAAAHWSIAAAARIGQMSQNFSDALFTASIPKSVRTGPYAEDAVDAYCDELTNQANPLEKVSVGAYSFCLAKSTQRSWFNRWSRLCEKELGQIRPQEFPTASEIRATSDELAPITGFESAVLKLEGTAP